MEKLLIIMGGMRLAGRGSLRGQIDHDPDLGFHYDSLHYKPGDGIAFKLYRSEMTGLLDHEIRLIEAYISAFRFRVWLLGKDGLPYAQVYQDEALGPYAHCLPPALPEHYWYNPDSGQWDIIYGVDDEGRYIGNVPLAQCARVANCRPSFDYERWDTFDMEWFDGRSMPELKQAAKATVRSTADLTKASGVIYGGKVCGSTADDYNACTDPVLKAVIVEYWAACDDRFRAACAEIDAAETADDIEKVAF